MDTHPSFSASCLVPIWKQSKFSPKYTIGSDITYFAYYIKEFLQTIHLMRNRNEDDA